MAPVLELVLPKFDVFYFNLNLVLVWYCSSLILEVFHISKAHIIYSYIMILLNIYLVFPAYTSTATFLLAYNRVLCFS
jgi:hypothetical protein